MRVFKERKIWLLNEEDIAPTMNDLITLVFLIVLVAIAIVVMRLLASRTDMAAPNTIDNTEPSGESSPKLESDEVHQLLWHGAELISDGYAYFPDWCSMITSEWDQHSEEELRDVFDAAEVIAKLPKSEWDQAIFQSKLNQVDV